MRLEWVPILVSMKIFAFLKERLQSHVNEWIEDGYQGGGGGGGGDGVGKEVLIISILLALPTYVMSTLFLPLETCENLANAIAQLWWSPNHPKRGVH